MPASLRAAVSRAVSWAAIQGLSAPSRIRAASLASARRIVGILGLHLLGDLRRAVVGVDELVEMLPEAVREPEVFLGCLAHERSKRAACPCPTPTQSVASP